MSSHMIEIDGARLRKAIERRGLTIYEAGPAIDRSKSFIGCVISSGRINKIDVKSLATVYGIKLAEYEIREEKEEETNDELEELEEIIAKAVLRALEEFKENHGPEAIVKAMERWRTEG